MYVVVVQSLVHVTIQRRNKQVCKDLEQSGEVLIGFLLYTCRDNTIRDYLKLALYNNIVLLENVHLAKVV